MRAPFREITKSVKANFRTEVLLTNLFVVYEISEQAMAIFRPASITIETKIYRFCFAEMFHTQPSPLLFGRRGVNFERNIRKRRSNTLHVYRLENKQHKIGQETRLVVWLFGCLVGWLVGLC
jgi:hypothetical protein